MLITLIPRCLIPSWHIPSFNNETVRSKAHPFGNMAYIGSMYMIVLLSYERYKAVHQSRQLTFKRTMVHIASVILFAIFYNLPTFWAYELVTENGIAKTKMSELACNLTFFMVYYVVLNASFRFIFPTICLVRFNIFIYKEVRYFKKFIIL